MNKTNSLSAKKIIVFVFLIISIVTISFITFAVDRSLREIKKQAVYAQAEMLAASARSSLQTDLLNNNFFLASERLKDMLEPRQWNGFCVKITDLSNGSRNLLSFGDDSICDRKDLIHFRQLIYFDMEKTIPAFELNIAPDPDRIPYQTSNTLVVVLFVTALAFFLPIVSLFFMANRFFSNLLSILRDEDKQTSIPGWLLSLSEFKAIVSITQERDRQRDLARDANERLEIANAIRNIASQVAHDIRSPLSALNMVTGDLKDLREDKRLLVRNAVQRINDIANGLLQQSKATKFVEIDTKASMDPSREEPVMLGALLDSIVSEKRLQYRDRMDVEIQADIDKSYGFFVNLVPTDFSRVVSNLVNNSIEALLGPGQVNLAVRGSKDQVSVIISDNGKGIPENVLGRLGERGISFGKEGTQSGNGLGIFHAREIVERSGGKFSIQSKLGIGTIVTMTFNRAKTPNWFVEKISLGQNTLVVSVDDDQTIHQVWRGRLVSAGIDSKMHYTFSSPEVFNNWIKESVNQNAIFLNDYEFLGQTINGLDLIEKNALSDRAFLVTSRYEEQHLRNRALNTKIKILPKSLAPFVPFEFEKHLEKFDAILIDDDSLVHMVWRAAAKDRDKRIIIFSGPEDFWANIDDLDPATPVYVDVNLGVYIINGGSQDF
jgi:signal transduction histidine kinase